MVNLIKIAGQVEAGAEATMTKAEILDALGTALWQIGILWDKVEGVDPHKGPRSKLGTANHRSMTYKLRKIAHYSYP